LSIVGDTELGLLIKNMLDAVEWPQLPTLPILRH
jgi:predicted lipid carrier protein YhbT